MKFLVVPRGMIHNTRLNTARLVFWGRSSRPPSSYWMYEVSFIDLANGHHMFLAIHFSEFHLNPIVLCLTLPRRRERETLDRLEPIFLGHLVDRRQCTLNDVIQTTPRCVLFSQTDIRPVENR